MDKICVDDIRLKIEADAQSYHLWAYCGGQWACLAGMESKYLSSEVCEGFTGVIIGLFCEDGNGGTAKFTVK